jgi:hypothetical protein
LTLKRWAEEHPLLLAAALGMSAGVAILLLALFAGGHSLGDALAAGAAVGATLFGVMALYGGIAKLVRDRQGRGPQLAGGWVDRHPWLAAAAVSFAAGVGVAVLRYMRTGDLLNAAVVGGGIAVLGSVGGGFVRAHLVPHIRSRNRDAARNG